MFAVGPMDASAPINSTTHPKSIHESDLMNVLSFGTKDLLTIRPSNYKGRDERLELDWAKARARAQS